MLSTSFGCPLFSNLNQPPFLISRPLLIQHQFSNKPPPLRINWVIMVSSNSVLFMFFWTFFTTLEFYPCRGCWSLSYFVFRFILITCKLYSKCSNVCLRRVEAWKTRWKKNGSLPKKSVHTQRDWKRMLDAAFGTIINIVSSSFSRNYDYYYSWYCWDSDFRRKQKVQATPR